MLLENQEKNGIQSLNRKEFPRKISNYRVVFIWHCRQLQRDHKKKLLVLIANSVGCIILDTSVVVITSLWFWEIGLGALRFRDFSSIAVLDRPSPTRRKLCNSIISDRKLTYVRKSQLLSVPLNWRNVHFGAYIHLQWILLAYSLPLEHKLMLYLNLSNLLHSVVFHNLRGDYIRCLLDDVNQWRQCIQSFQVHSMQIFMLGKRTRAHNCTVLLCEHCSTKSFLELISSLSGL